MLIMYLLKEMINMGNLTYLEWLCSKNISWHFSLKNLIQTIKIQRVNINLNSLVEFKKKELFKVNGSIAISLKLISSRSHWYKVLNKMQDPKEVFLEAMDKNQILWT